MDSRELREHCDRMFPLDKKGFLSVSDGARFFGLKKKKL